MHRALSGPLVCVAAAACAACATAPDAVDDGDDSVATDGGASDGTQDTAPTNGIDTAAAIETIIRADSDDADADDAAGLDTLAADATQPDTAPLPQCATAADCTKFGDGDLCNGTLTCADGDCIFAAGSAIFCDPSSDTACAQNVCNPLSGSCALDPSPLGTPCTDADPCTVDSSCAAGKCVGSQTSWCQCQQHADCTKLEDGNLCNGTLYCDKQLFPYRCQLNPATVVQCFTGADTDCTVNTCEPQSGKCAPTSAADGASCSDGDKCTITDACKSGVCAGFDACQCHNDNDCAKYEDGNLCNGTLTCNTTAGVCAVDPPSVVTCTTADDTACQHNTCQPQTGSCALAAVPDHIACADDDVCTVGDNCKAGACTSGVDVCQCKADADCDAYEDGDLCNGTLVCQLTTHQCIVAPATAVTCTTNLDTTCRKSTCQPKSGKCAMTAVNSLGACDDGQACTVGDTCKAGACTAGVDICQCHKDADCTPFDDGDLCNGTMRCNVAKVPYSCASKPNSTVTCSTSSDTTCRANVCQPKTGQCVMTAQQNGKACDDGDSCTISDACTAGQCKGADTCPKAPTWTEVYPLAFGGACSGCHGSFSDKSTTYGSLINNFYCGSKLVVPGNPSQSTIIAKLGQGVPLSCGSKMPNGSSGIGASALSKLKEWIAAGAKND